MSYVVFGAFGKSRQFWFLRNHINGVCCLLIEYGIYVGAYGIRPLRRRMSRTANRRRKIANPRNSGRMPYALYAAA